MYHPLLFTLWFAVFIVVFLMDLKTRPSLPYCERRSTFAVFLTCFLWPITAVWMICEMAAMGWASLLESFMDGR